MTKTPRKAQRRLIPKFLLLLAYTAVIVFLSTIFFMKNELRRIGFFNTESASRPPEQPLSSSTLPPKTEILGETPAPAPPPAGTAPRAETLPPSRRAEEITRDDKKQLDDVLRARGGKQ
jgi:hypothetical protein